MHRFSSVCTRLVCQSFVCPISLRTCFPSALCLFSVVPADFCTILSLSGVHWRLMGSIGMECLHGWLLIGAKATEAWRPSSSQTQNYCAWLAELGQGTVCEMVCIRPVLYRVCVCFSSFLVTLAPSHCEIANQLLVLSNTELVTWVVC